MATLLKENGKYILQDITGQIIDTYSEVIKSDFPHYLAREDNEQGKWVLVSTSFKGDYGISDIKFDSYEFYKPYNETHTNESIYLILRYFDIQDSSAKCLLFKKSGLTLLPVKNHLNRINEYHEKYDNITKPMYEDVFSTNTPYLIVKDLNSGKFGIVNEFLEEVTPCIYNTKEDVPNDIFSPPINLDFSSIVNIFYEMIRLECYNNVKATLLLENFAEFMEKNHMKFTLKESGITELITYLHTSNDRNLEDVVSKLRSWFCNKGVSSPFLSSAFIDWMKTPK